MEGEELAIIEQEGIIAFREPEEILKEARKAARALANVLKAKPQKVMIGGEQYLEFEDWQTLGQFYGCFCKTGEAKPVTIDGVFGAFASAVLYDKNGKVIGGADAYCMSDEKNWKDKPWFQLASMAQTRAGAKALRNRLAWVAVLAGYRPIPAEELEREEKTESHKLISEAQQRRLWLLAQSHFTEQGVPQNEQADVLRVIVEGEFGFSSLKDIPTSQYEAIIKRIKTWKP